MMTESLSTPQNLTLHDASGAVAATLWRPHADADAASSRAPILVMLPDYYGLDEALQNAAARVCALGYMVLVPDILAGTNVPAPDAAPDELGDWALKQSDSANVNRVLRAIESARELEGADAERVGVLGWGWSGALALIAAGHGAPVRVACDIGGTISYPVTTANRPGSPLNFVADLNATFFAAFASEDEAFPDEEIRRLHARLVEHEKSGEVKVYQAPAHFWRDDSLPQTQAFWRRLTHFLAENLSGTEEGNEPLGAYPNEEARLQA